MTDLLATSGPTAYWYLTRGSGIVALLLLSASIALGVATSTRWRNPSWPRFVVSGLHRNLTLLAVAFVALHVVTTIADGFAPIGLRDAFIPFLSPYRPIWLGLGAVALDLLIALVATSLLRHRLGYRTWHAVHLLAYAAWPVALVHGLGTGTDVRLRWMILLSAACTALVVIVVLWRLAAAREQRPLATGAGSAAALVVGLGILVWYWNGPLQHGWARRAGTPVSLLPTARAAVQPTSLAVPARSATWPRPPFTGTLRGRISERGPDPSDLVTVTIVSRTSGAVHGSLAVTLVGAPTGDGGVAMTASGVTFGPTRDPRLYDGRIVALEGTRLVASMQSRSGPPLLLDVGLRIDSTGHAVTGVLRATPRGPGDGGE